MQTQQYAYIGVCIAIAVLCAVYGCVAHKCRQWSDEKDQAAAVKLSKGPEDTVDWEGDCLFTETEDCERGLAHHTRHHGVSD